MKNAKKKTDNKKQQNAPVLASALMMKFYKSKLKTLNRI
jgi:hypothetical protein